MTKIIRTITFKDKESVSDIFKREISSTRQLARDIISDKRESDKTRDLQHFIPRQKCY